MITSCPAAVRSLVASARLAGVSSTSTILAIRLWPDRRGSVFGEDEQRRFLAHRLAQVPLRLVGTSAGSTTETMITGMPLVAGCCLQLSQDLLAVASRHEHIEKDRAGRSRPASSTAA